MHYESESSISVSRSTCLFAQNILYANWLIKTDVRPVSLARQDDLALIRSQRGVGIKDDVRDLLSTGRTEWQLAPQ